MSVLYLLKRRSIISTQAMLHLHRYCLPYVHCNREVGISYIVRNQFAYLLCESRSIVLPFLWILLSSEINVRLRINQIFVLIWFSELNSLVRCFGVFLQCLFGRSIFLYLLLARAGKAIWLGLCSVYSCLAYVTWHFPSHNYSWWDLGICTV